MQDAMPLKAKRFRIRHLLLAVIALAAAAGAGTGIYLWSRGGDGESARVVTAVQISYPDGWREQPLSEADRRAGLLLNLGREDPEASFLARTVIARLAEDFDIDGLAEETERALKAEIENFELLNRDVGTVNSFEVVTIHYRQRQEAAAPQEEAAAPEDAAEHEAFMAIVPTQNQTFYLTFRAEKSDFRQIEREGLQIVGTFLDYISAQLSPE